MTNHRAQMWCLVLDSACRQIVLHLEAAGHRPIVMKGQTIARWLYPNPDDRVYTDLDLLVSPSERDAVVARLQEIGYRPLIDERMLRSSSLEEQPLADVRGVAIDLHVALKGVRLEAEEAWRILDEHTTRARWASFEVRALDPAARAMHLALHVAQRGLVDTKAAQDLKLGLALLPDEIWSAATDLAVGLRATGAYSAGLALLPAGEALIHRLGIDPSADTEARIRASSSSTSALFLERVLAAHTWRERLRIASGRLFPSAEWMRNKRPGSTATPTTMLVARVTRPFQVLGKLPRAVRERRAARLP